MPWKRGKWRKELALSIDFSSKFINTFISLECINTCEYFINAIIITITINAIYVTVYGTDI